MNVYFLASRYFGLEGVGVPFQCHFHGSITLLTVVRDIATGEAATDLRVTELTSSETLAVEFQTTGIFARAALKWLQSAHLFQTSRGT